MLPPGAHVLVVRLSALGDVVFALETVASLRAERPDVVVDFLVDERSRALVEGHPDLDRVLVLPRHRPSALPAAVRALRRRRYDAVLDLHGIARSALAVRLTRSRLRVGYAPPIAKEGSHRGYQVAVPLPERPPPHKAERGYALLRALGLQGTPAQPALPWPTEGVSFVSDVVLHPGTSDWAAFKRWPTRSFGEFARRLLDRGLTVRLSVGPGEDNLAAEVDAAAGRQLERLQGDVASWARGLAASRVVVAPDTAALHLAAAVGTPVVALFGPKDPVVYGPRAPVQRTLFHDVPCRPCRRRACPSPVCVLGISVDEVEDAVHGLLTAQPATAERTR